MKASSTGTRRRVHFCENDGVADDDIEFQQPLVEIMGPLLIPSSEMSLRDKRDIWWQPQEFEAHLDDAKNLATQSQRRESLPFTSSHSSNDDMSYTKVVWNVYKSCKERNARGPTNKQLYKLSQWARVAHSRRGLERVCVRELGVSRTRQKQQVIQGVLSAQERLKRESTSEAEQVELISAVSKTLTRSSRMFAAVMGEADARAVAPVDEDLNNSKTWTNCNQSTEESSSKVMTSFRIGARILRRASFQGVSRSVSLDKKRRLSLTHVAA